ncbi:MAG: DsbA family protein [Bacteroidota bacterium]
MKRLLVLPLLSFVLFTGPACGQSATADEDRKSQVLTNLRFEFPQLDQYQVEMGDFAPSGVDGLMEGSFVVNGQQTQRFLISDDNTKLYLIAADPVDVSRDEAALAEALAEREAEARQENEARAAQLDAAIAGLPVRGNPDAPVTVIEFSDFQCPYCSRAATTMEELIEKRGDEVKFVYMQYPLPNHPWARPASIAALCAAQQDDEAFWMLHDGYFANQRSLNTGNVLAESQRYIAGADLDADAWLACADGTDESANEGAVAALDASMQLAQELGVSGTPGFFVNGEFLNGAKPLAEFEAIIDQITSDS